MDMKGMTMANEEKEASAAALIGWPIAIIMASTLLLGGFSGYNQATVDHGGSPLAGWVGPLVAMSLAAIGFTAYFRRYAPTIRRWSPRKRRYWLALAFCAMIGGIIGGLLVADQPAGGSSIDMMSDGPLSAGFAIGAALTWIVGLTIGMIAYHRSIDDHEERAWLWACVAGWYAFVFPAPAWWVLHRADLAPSVDVAVLFSFSLIVNALVWLWLKFR